LDASITAAVLIAVSVLAAFGKVFTRDRPNKKLKDWQVDDLLTKTGTKTSEESRMLLKRKLLQAGLEMEPEYFAGLQYALPLVSMIVLLPLVLLGVLHILLVIIIALILLVAPRMWLNSKAKNRVAAIEKDLPDFCTAFAAVLEAGADWRTAIREVCYSTKGELSAEFTKTMNAIDAGGERPGDALADMAYRCGIPDLTDLLRKIDQSHRYGTKLANVVRSHAEKIMTRRRHEGTKKAGELTIKLLPIILFFCLLPMMGLLFFPVMYHLGNAFG